MFLISEIISAVTVLDYEHISGNYSAENKCCYQTPWEKSVILSHRGALRSQKNTFEIITSL